jgi:hypothetical protein
MVLLKTYSDIQAKPDLSTDEHRHKSGISEQEAEARKA